MFAMLSVLIISLSMPFQARAEIAPVIESKTTFTPKSTSSIFHPRVEWLQRTESPMFGLTDGDPSLTVENYLGLNYKVAKRQKVGVRVSALHSMAVGESGHQEFGTEVGDAHVRWVDSSLKDLFNDQVDIVLTHKMYLPLRERSVQRMEITHYKGWAAISHNIGSRWTLIGNILPSFYAFRRPAWKDAKGKSHANVLYDFAVSTQAMYMLTEHWYASLDVGWSRREYLKLKDVRETPETFPHTLSMTYVSDNLEVAMGVGAEIPTTILKFNHANVFSPEFTTVFVESNLRVF